MPRSRALPIAAVLPLAGALALAACGGPELDPDTAADEQDEDIFDGRVEVPAAPEEGKGLQFIQPELIVEPGQEIQQCWIPDWVPEQDYMISSFNAFQNPMGHHLIALRSEVYREPGSTFDCTNLEQMQSIRLLVSPNTDVTPKVEATGYAGRLMPEEFAVRMPKDTIIVFQSHYINYGDKPMKVADVANVNFVPEPEWDDYIESSYFTLNHGGINVPAGDADFTTEARCTIENDITLISLMGHMHDWGQWITIERERGADRELLYEITDWDVDFRDLAPVAEYTIDEPLELLAGDEFIVTCNYDNDTDEDLPFPSEMCVGFGVYFPADYGDIICD